jgi:sodium-dependent dicarboxylate transporter 2/3/5
MVVASIMPLLNALGNKSGISKALLLGVPIAATTGGMGSIIGSPPNLIAVGALENIGINVSFLDWMIYGFPIALALTAISCIVLIKLFIKDKHRSPWISCMIKKPKDQKKRKHKGRSF